MPIYVEIVIVLLQKSCGGEDIHLHDVISFLASSVHVGGDLESIDANNLIDQSVIQLQLWLVQ